MNVSGHTSSALSFPFLLKRGAISLDCICSCAVWFCLWLKTGEFCPFWKRFKIHCEERWLPKFTITEENYIVAALYIPGLVLCMVCFLLQTEAGVNCCRLQHGHCSAGLCDDVPWLGNSGPEWPLDLYLCWFLPKQDKHYNIDKGRFLDWYTKVMV